MTFEFIYVNDKCDFVKISSVQDKSCVQTWPFNAENHSIRLVIYAINYGMRSVVRIIFDKEYIFLYEKVY